MMPPNIMQDVNKKFMSAFMQIQCQDHKHYIEVCKKLRYFEIEGKECRALPLEE